MNEQIFLSIIIPAYNEEHRITQTLLDIDKKLKNKNWTYEILVINDGSNDKTSEVVNNLISKIKELKLIDNKENHGKGYVVKQGMLQARGKYCLFMDADNSTTIDQFDNFLPWFEKDYDIVIGSIEIEGAKINEQAGFYRRFLGHFGKLLIRLFLGLKIYDTQRGFKAFANYAIKPIFERQTIMRWGFDFEILYIANKLGYKIKEVPVIWNNSADSKVKPSAYISVLLELLKVRWNALCGK
ncbi:MAG: glycosyltransferase family 2 protein, partial [Patescibacteria group bacterium]|nr:glycosyltransferase family 2 protein [Patescibacteria group bacterium]